MSVTPAIRRYDQVLLDLDGCLWIGDQAVDGSAEAVAARLKTTDWALVYQSRSGRPQDPWLEPDVNAYLRAAREDGVTAVEYALMVAIIALLMVAGFYTLFNSVKGKYEDVGNCVATEPAPQDCSPGATLAP